MNEIFVLMIYKFHYLQMGYFDNMFSLISATKTMIRLLESKSLFKELISLFPILKNYDNFLFLNFCSKWERNTFLSFCLLT